MNRRILQSGQYTRQVVTAKLNTGRCLSFTLRRPSAMNRYLYAHARPGLQQAAAHGFDKVLVGVGDQAEIEETSRV